MQCYFYHENHWYKGHITSMRGGNEIAFVARNDDNAIIKELTLLKPEILFFGDSCSVTGYFHKKDNTIAMESIEVKFSQRKPK